jgi:hypothetical protein
MEETMKEGKMKIKSSLSVCTILLLTTAFVLLVAGSALAGEEVRTQTRITSQERLDDSLELRTRLKNQLRKETGLSEEDLQALDPVLAEALELNGQDAEALRMMVRKAVQIDCVGECLMDRLRDQNRQMLQDRKKDAEGDQLAVREETRTRTRTMDGDQSGESARSETQSQTRDGSGSGEGSGSGGGSGTGRK